MNTKKIQFDCCIFLWLNLLSEILEFNKVTDLDKMSIMFYHGIDPVKEGEYFGR